MRTLEMTGERAERMEEGEKAGCAREGETIAGETGKSTACRKGERGLKGRKRENEH